MLYAYEPNDWIADWTLFYWAWWISWSPFVGMFIARISRGRTIREFVLGVLFVPTGFTLVWMTVFGNTAIWLQLSGATNTVSETVATSIPLALFAFLEQFPLSGVSSALATLLVVTFFVTSADFGRAGDRYHHLRRPGGDAGLAAGLLGAAVGRGGGGAAVRRRAEQPADRDHRQRAALHPGDAGSCATGC